MSKIKVVHYINQFFANIGGEEKADYPVTLRKGEVVGPGIAFASSFEIGRASCRERVCDLV